MSVKVAINIPFYWTKATQIFLDMGQFLCYDQLELTHEEAEALLHLHQI